MFQKLTAWCNGRTTTFCIGFFVAGNVLHALHRLDGTYIGFMSTLMGFVVAHSVKEDYANRTTAKSDAN
jgi:hypothetical protein